jgi:hypothetical protein
MFHTNTQKIIEDWTTRRGDRHTPRRTDISPAALKDLIPQLFMLGSGEAGDEAFRLAGELLLDVHGRELRGVDFFSLFYGSDRERVRQALAEARMLGTPVVLSASGWSAEGDEAQIEVVLAPLTGPTGELDRVLGLYQPTSSLRRLMGASVQLLTLREVRMAGSAFSSPDAPFPRARHHLRLAALDGVRID